MSTVTVVRETHAGQRLRAFHAPMNWSLTLLCSCKNASGGGNRIFLKPLLAANGEGTPTSKYKLRNFGLFDGRACRSDERTSMRFVSQQQIPNNC
eukprot:6204548-Pleurochrysis_carterae.AAC.1